MAVAGAGGGAGAAPRGRMSPVAKALRPHILSAEGVAALHRTLAQRPLLAFDFDGTLAPIVARPDLARMPAAVSERLRHIAAQWPVAIVTGRALEDLRRRLDFEPRYLVGSHGAENPLEAQAPAWVSAMALARDWLAPWREEIESLGVSVEDKRSSMALHYRLAPEPVRARRRLAQMLGTAPPALQVFGGKRVFNIVPAHAPDKADAVLMLVAKEGASTAIFVGDDVNDEPVFRRAPATWLTVRVGRARHLTQARYGLNGVDEMPRLLDQIMAPLSGSDSLIGTD